MAPTNALQVDPSNAEQLRAWDGEEGSYWAEHASYFERSAAPFHRRLLDAAAVAPDERVLDIGCGTGASTLAAARAAPSGAALGIDLSSQMIAHARARADAEGLTNVAFEQADAQIHPFPPASFDLAVSSTGAMFFGDPVAAFRNIGAALRRRARMVLLTWQALADNEWIREFRAAMAAGRDLPAPPPNVPGPFTLADPEHVSALLGSAGFGSVEIEGAHVDMWFGDEAEDARRFVLGLLRWMLEGLDASGRARAVDDLHETMAAHETSEGVVFDSAVWIVRAKT